MDEEIHPYQGVMDEPPQEQPHIDPMEHNGVVDLTEFGGLLQDPYEPMANPFGIDPAEETAPPDDLSMHDPFGYHPEHDNSVNLELPLIDEVGLPGLDAASKDADGMSIEPADSDLQWLPK